MRRRSTAKATVPGASGRLDRSTWRTRPWRRCASCAPSLISFSPISDPPTGVPTMHMNKSAAAAAAAGRFALARPSAADVARYGKKEAAEELDPKDLAREVRSLKTTLSQRDEQIKGWTERASEEIKT